jgi:hypothetical protein
MVNCFQIAVSLLRAYTLEVQNDHTKSEHLFVGYQDLQALTGRIIDAKANDENMPFELMHLSTFHGLNGVFHVLILLHS